MIETGPDPIAGFTRLKAATSQKVVLDLLSTLIMVARNEKRHNRALRIVMNLTACTEPNARDALTRAGDGCSVSPACGA